MIKRTRNVRMYMIGSRNNMRQRHNTISNICFFFFLCKKTRMKDGHTSYRGWATVVGGKQERRNKRELV